LPARASIEKFLNDGLPGLAALRRPGNDKVEYAIQARA
jgi:hypothetical protein